VKHRSQTERLTTTGQQKPEAFNLVELLVVVAIIAILAGLLLSAFARTKADAKRVACISNERQLVTALIMYADSDSRQSMCGRKLTRKFYPQTIDENWLLNRENLPVKIFFCPATRNGAEAEKHRRWDKGEQMTIYTDIAHVAASAAAIGGYSYDSLLWFADMENYWNGNLDTDETSRFVEKTLSNIQTYTHVNEAFGMEGRIFGPSRVWLFTDNDCAGDNGYNRYWPEPINNHGAAGGNTAFGDGHVEWIPRRDYVYKHEASQDNNRTRETPTPIP